MFGRVYLGFLGLEVKSEEQTNLAVLEGRFDWRQIVGVRNKLCYLEQFGVSLMEVVWFVVFWFVVWWLVWAGNGIRE